jgi:hypothetical protein
MNQSFFKVREKEMLRLRLEALKYREISGQVGIIMKSVNTPWYSRYETPRRDRRMARG